MKNNFSITITFAFVLIITVITTLTTIYFSQTELLKGPSQEGTVVITDILPIVDVIIIDDSIIAGISDTVEFSATAAGNSYTTDVDPLSPAPYPFVIRNNGNVRANVEIDQKRNALQPNVGLFADDASRLKYWIERSRPIAGVIGYDQIDNCIPLATDCFISAMCSTQPNPTDTGCIIPLANDGRTQAISSLNYVDASDEVFLHILIYISPAEPVGTKSTIITITGSQA